MTRRGFFSAIAAAVAAGVAMPRERAIEIVRIPDPFPLYFEPAAFALAREVDRAAFGYIRVVDKYEPRSLTEARLDLAMTWPELEAKILEPLRAIGRDYDADFTA